MDYLFKSRLFFSIIFLESILQLDLYQCQEEGNNILKPRIYTTKYGNLIGMLIPFKNKGLRPVEVFSGLQYATTRRKMLRFIPPTSSLEKWLGNRIFSKRINRGVCPQSFSEVKRNSVNYSHNIMDHLQRIESYISFQAEDCLMMNLYVPRKGRNFPYIVYLWCNSYFLSTLNETSLHYIIVSTSNYWHDIVCIQVYCLTLISICYLCFCIYISLNVNHEPKCEALVSE